MVIVSTKLMDCICLLLVVDKPRTEYNKTLVSLCGGDLIYLRALRDHNTELGAEVMPGELTFKAGSILYVDNTAHAGRVGVWHAWLLDVYGNPTTTHGILPNKMR
jgi:hypothetical protein